MNIDKCPKCNSTVTTLWRKMKLGPMRKINCPSCGCKISVAWVPYIFVSLVSQLALFFGGLAGIFLLNGYSMPLERVIWVFPLLFLLGCLVVLPIIIYAHYYFVPMVSKDA